MSLHGAIRHQLSRLKGSVVRNLNRVRSIESIFSSIYLHGQWGNGESISGSGSNVDQTERIRDVLPILFRRYDIKTMLDIPCGDFNWMRWVDLSTVRYLGADIVKSIVRTNQARYTQENINFIVADITRDKLPCVDLIICRDCLVHLSNKHVMDAIRTVIDSGSTYLLTTTFPSQAPTDIVTGSWRPINLQRRPFDFPHALELIEEGYHKPSSGVSDKSLGLWRIVS